MIATSSGCRPSLACRLSAFEVGKTGSRSEGKPRPPTSTMPTGFRSAVIFWAFHAAGSILMATGRRDNVPTTVVGWSMVATVLLLTVWLAISRRNQARTATGSPAAYLLLGAWLCCFHFMYYDVLLFLAGFSDVHQPKRYLDVLPRQKVHPVVRGYRAAGVPWIIRPSRRDGAGPRAALGRQPHDSDFDDRLDRDTCGPAPDTRHGGIRCASGHGLPNPDLALVRLALVTRTSKAVDP